MAKFDSTLATLAIASAVAVTIGVLATTGMSRKGEQSSANWSGVAAYATQPPAARPLWAASATGRIEPKGGEARITTQVPGKVVEVPAKTGDKVREGDLLVRLDDEDARQKIASAEAEALVRERERDEEPAEGLAQDRREAEDKLAASERALFKARLAFDEAATALRNGRGSAEDVETARQKITAAEESVATDRAALQRLVADPKMPLPTRLESSLEAARADLRLAESAFEKTRIRAPFDGTVLNVIARTGEVVAPSPDAPLALLGDLTGLRVKAEVEERDALKVSLGQKVVVRADALQDREFEGTVTSIAKALGPPRIAPRGPRRPNDVEVLEVLATLDGNPPLVPGMRVDVFFKLDSTAQSAQQPKSN
jgi:HlyD family secretion protein